MQFDLEKLKSELMSNKNKTKHRLIFEAFLDCTFKYTMLTNSETDYKFMYNSLKELLVASIINEKQNTTQVSILLNNLFLFNYYYMTDDEINNGIILKGNSKYCGGKQVCAYYYRLNKIDLNVPVRQDIYRGLFYDTDFYADVYQTIIKYNYSNDKNLKRELLVFLGMLCSNPLANKHKEMKFFVDKYIARFKKLFPLYEDFRYENFVFCLLMYNGSSSNNNSFYSCIYDKKFQRYLMIDINMELFLMTINLLKVKFNGISYTIPNDVFKDLLANEFINHNKLVSLVEYLLNMIYTLFIQDNSKIRIVYTHNNFPINKDNKYLILKLLDDKYNSEEFVKKFTKKIFFILKVYMKRFCNNKHKRKAIAKLMDNKRIKEMIPEFIDYVVENPDDIINVEGVKAEYFEYKLLSDNGLEDEFL